MIIPLHPSSLDRRIVRNNVTVVVVDSRTLSMYPLAEVARIVGAPSTTVRGWFPPLRGNQLNFLQLVEAFLIQVLRKKYRMRMKQINKGREDLRKRTRLENPLAYENLGIETDGRGIYFQDGEVYSTAGEDGQLALRELLKPHLKRLEYGTDGRALRLFPFTKGYDDSSPMRVVIDPRFNFGRPCTVNGAISTLMIARRNRAGESREAIARDYNCTREDIDEAINQEEAARAA